MMQNETTPLPPEKCLDGTSNTYGYEAEDMAAYAAAEAERAVAQERERCALLVAGNYGWCNGAYFDDLADAVRGLPAPDGEGPPIPRMADGSPADPEQYGVLVVTPREPGA